MSHFKASRTSRVITWGRDLLAVLGPLVRCVLPLFLANVAFTLLAPLNPWLAILAYFAGVAFFPVLLVREFRRIRDAFDQRMVGALVSVLHTANHAQPAPAEDPDPSTTEEESRVIFDELAALSSTSPALDDLAPKASV